MTTGVPPSVVDGGEGAVGVDDTGPDDEEPATAAVRAFVRDVVLPGITDTPLLDAAMVVALPVDLTERTARVVLDLARRHGLDPVPDPLLLLEAAGVVARLPAVGGTPQRWVMPAVLRDELRAHLAEHDRAFVVEAHRTLAQDWTLLELVSLEFGTYLAVIGGATVDDCYARVPDQVAATSW